MQTDLTPFWLSLRVASLATILVVVLGVPIALGLARLRFPGKGFVAGSLMIPLVLPPTVLGYVLLELLGRQSAIGAWLETRLGLTLVFHWSGVVIASACSAFPLFLMPVRSAFEEVDPALEDAARLLGRRELGVFLNVTLPLAWRGLIAGLLLAFARSLGDFGASLMVGGAIPGETQTTSMAIYDAVLNNDPVRATYLSAWVSMISILALILVQRTIPDRRPAARGAP